jgi:hypothetical protein
MEFYLLIIFFFLLLIIYNLVKFWRVRADFLALLGAQLVGTHRLINPKGVLNFGGLNIEVFTSDYKGKRLNLKIRTNFTGFLTLRKKDIFDKLTRQLTYQDLAVEYEDKEWFERLTSHQTFKVLLRKLLEEASIDRLEIRKNTLTIGWNIKRSPFEVSTDKVHQALNLLKDTAFVLSTLPSSWRYKEDLRNLLLFKLPILLTLIACLVGIVGRFYQYNPLCPLEIVFFGYKLFTPFVLIYLGFLCFYVGGYGLYQRILGSGFLVFFVCIFFISLFFLSYINGRFDTSPSQIKRDRIESKYYSIKRGYRLTLSNLHKEKKLCDSLSVSKNFYYQVEIGDYIEYETKKGFLGIEWFYRGLYLPKNRVNLEIQ